MPELPDVEHMRRVWGRYGTGRVVEHVVTLDPAIVRNAAPDELDAAMRGQRLEDPERIGKWLIVPTSGPSLLLHFGMTGDISWAPTSAHRHQHDRVVLELDHGELRYRNMRKFGGAWLARDEGEMRAIMGPLGPDALKIDRTTFLERLGRRRGKIKAALMDQSLLSGIGNLLADEILWHARIHPAGRIEQLGSSVRIRLFSAMRRVLARWVEGYGSLPRGWLIHARGRTDRGCPRCAAQLSRAAVGGRTTYFCANCQRGAER